MPLSTHRSPPSACKWISEVGDDAKVVGYIVSGLFSSAYHNQFRSSSPRFQLVFCVFVARKLLDEFAHHLGILVMIIAIVFTSYLETGYGESTELNLTLCVNMEITFELKTLYFSFDRTIYNLANTLNTKQCTFMLVATILI
ncbi:hypothetical protein L6452_02189 [Arctium lappa]|uniref:Uncharacterized protein n=1 Tax=Arctium lappa TaxID=4217 RepID=A0ACB9FIX7_ARCLA|nr:hypothetical protein L6452_02189 [Arctium lappa]